MTHSSDVLDFVTAQLATPDSHWSLGTFGAIAEFMRDRNESRVALTDVSHLVVTARGGIRIDSLSDVRLVASEIAGRESWSRQVALCLPEDRCAMARRNTLSELGLDVTAIREEDRGAVLFDLGLGARQVDVCVRSSDADVIAALRAGVGLSLFDPANSAYAAITQASPNRVFVCRFARIEVFQPIPPPDGRSPEGPHTHVLPHLLRSGLSHAATEPIPDGYVPCAHIYPAHPAKDAVGRRRHFDAERFDEFQRILRKFGNADLAEVKDQVVAALRAGDDASSIRLPDSRFARNCVRVAIRQLRASGELRCRRAVERARCRGPSCEKGRDRRLCCRSPRYVNCMVCSVQRIKNRRFA